MDEQRRVFLLRSAGAAVASGATGRAQGQVRAPAGSAGVAGPAAPDSTYLFFTVAKAAFVTAAVERLIPSDDSGPGAAGAGVPQFIDRQLAGAWGAGERLYRSDPWQAGTPTQGYQLPFTPAELFRNAMGALLQEWRPGAPFHLRLAAEQDAILRALQTDKRDLSGLPSKVFFETLWALILEGFFSDPVYGGNRNAVGWRLVGFPGAYANYYQEVDRHGQAFGREPVSLADDGRGRLSQERVHEHLGAGGPQPSAPHQAGGR